MIARIRARYANGVLTPLEPLDIEEGAEIRVSVENAPAATVEDNASPKPGTESILEMFDRVRESTPPDAWDDMPADGSKNYKHYLYGHPKVEN